MRRIRVIDTHTGGEPTRVVMAGGPDLEGGSMRERRARFRERFDDLRSAIINEPRGSDVMIGALVCEPVDPTCAAGVIYFNNAGYLNMCGHGTIGVVVALAHAGRLGPGEHRLETPVGVVTVRFHGGSEVTFENVPSHRRLKDVILDVEGHGSVMGDVAWGGNWFFLSRDHRYPLDLGHVDRLTDYAWRIRETLKRQGITGDDGQEIDHVDLFGPPRNPTAQSRNFVLCPGKAYDRSPCGTGTSAKLACLHADGELRDGDVWRQESIVGSIFDGTIRVEDGRVVPIITGSAYVCAETTLMLDPTDPFQFGVIVKGLPQRKR